MSSCPFHLLLVLTVSAFSSWLFAPAPPPSPGLTTRPRITNLSNPYTIAAQSDMVLQLCSALGLRQVVLVAHADGCLVTLRAAATSVG